MSIAAQTEPWKLAADLRDMFTTRWGFAEPPPAHRAQWQRDLDTLTWAGTLADRAPG